MAGKFISIVKESQNQTVPINTKPTDIMGCFILREVRQRTEKTWNSSGPWKAWSYLEERELKRCSRDSGICGSWSIEDPNSGSRRMNKSLEEELKNPKDLRKYVVNRRDYKVY